LRAGSRAHTASEAGFGLGLGVVAAVLSIAVSLSIDPLVAPLVPIAVMFGCAALAQPVAAVLLLVGLSYLDALGKTVFFFSPVSPFKLFTGIAILALILQSTRFRAGIQHVASTGLFRLYVAFMLAWVVAIMMAESMSQAVSWGADLATVTIILPLILFVLQREDHIKWAIWIVAFASGISALILIADIALGTRLISTSEAATTARTAEGFDRSSGGSNENPTTAATMLLTGTIIALVHAIESPVRRKLFATVAVIGTIGVLLSFARSSLIVYTLIAMVLAVRYRRHRLFPLACAFGVMGVAAMLPFLPESFWDRVLSIFGGGGDWTLGRRLSYNLIGIDLLLQHPITGVGPGNFYSLFAENEYRFLPGRTLGGRQLHNMYLSVAVEYGMIGFACFIGLISAGLRACKITSRAAEGSQTRATAAALYYGMLAYFLVSVFVPNEYNKYTWLLPALGAALYLAEQRRPSKVGLPKEPEA